MNKRNIILAGTVLVIVIATVVFYQNRTATTSSSKQSLATTSPKSNANLPTNVSYAKLIGETIHYLNTGSGNFASYSLDKHEQKELSQFLIDTATVTWGPDGTKVLSVSSDEQNPSVITTSDGSMQQLDAHVYGPTWSNDGKQILYQYVNGSTGQIMIAIAKPDGSNWQNIVTTSNLLDSLWWSPLGTYAIGTDGSANPPQYDLIAISSKKIAKLATGYGNLKWSPSGKLALLDSTDGKSLMVADVTTGIITTLDLPAIVDQFTWQDETHIVGFSDRKVVSIDLSTKKIQTITALPSTVDQYAQVLGVYNKELLFVDNETVLEIPLNQ